MSAPLIARFVELAMRSLDNANNYIDYNQSFSTGFWLNVDSVRLDGQPGVLSNRDVDTSTNPGFTFFTNKVDHAGNDTGREAFGLAGIAELAARSRREGIARGQESGVTRCGLASGQPPRAR